MPMEDPWANAWGEPTKSVDDDAQKSWPIDPKPSLGALNHEAAVVPSWVTSGGVQWGDEPLEGQTGIQHSSESAADDWDTADASSPSHRRVPDSINNIDRSPTPEVTIQAPVSTPEKESVHVSYNGDFTDSAILPSAPTSVPSSPDAFGTFETGLTANEVDVDPWAQSLPSDTSKEKGAWDSFHATSNYAGVIERVDEWEAAKRQKEKQDQHVPPHILGSIHSEFQSLSSDFWPSVSSSQNEEPSGIADRQRGMIEFESLPITNRLIPKELTLPSYVAFHKTFTKKHMGDALRLTRHVPIVHSSPFNLYLSSKGSTTWESSVSKQIMVADDDFLPSGWRVLGKGNEDTKPELDAKKKTTGGLLSFFGRKPSATSLEDNHKRSGSPNQEPPKYFSATTVGATTPTPSARASIDKSHSTHSSTSTPPKPSSLLPNSADIAPISSAESSQSGPEQAPSAVSRFLNRFSRSKASDSNSRDSLALSTDDIEFLSDIIPNANDETDETLQLRDLSNMLASPPLPTGLPPPLAPPPNAPSPKDFRPHPSKTNHISSQFPSNNDIISLLDSPAGSSQPKSTSILPPTTLTDFATPLASRASSKIETQATSLSAYRSGRSSPSNPTPSSQKWHASPSGKRTPVAVMSTGSSSSKSDAFTPLPPPPILPPPPETKPVTRTNHSHQSSQKSLVNAGVRSSTPPTTSPPLYADTGISSVFSDQSLLPDMSSKNRKINNDFLDDFDEFVSSPNKDPFPPHPTSKPFGQQPFTRQVRVFPHPPTPQSSLLSSNIAQIGLRTTPQPSSLTRPATVISNTSGNFVPGVQMTGGVSDLSPPTHLNAFPPPPGFNTLRPPTASPQPLHLQATFSNLVAPKGQPQQPSQAKYNPSATPVASGGLSAQDLSFFEGI